MNNSPGYLKRTTFVCAIVTGLAVLILLSSCITEATKEIASREIISLNDYWLFFRYMVCCFTK